MGLHEENSVAIMDGMEPILDQTDSAAPKRVRLIIDTTKRLRKAVQLRTYRLSAERREKVSVSDLLNEILEREFAGELAEDEGAPPKPPKKRK